MIPKHNKEEGHETQSQRDSATAWFRTAEHPYHETREAQLENELQTSILKAIEVALCYSISSTTILRFPSPGVTLRPLRPPSSPRFGPSLTPSSLTLYSFFILSASKPSSTLAA